MRRRLLCTEALQLAKELKGFVSEPGYVSPGTDTDYLFRHFSSEREVAFGGQATIAILKDIVAISETTQEKAILSIATKTDQLLPYKIVKGRLETLFVPIAGLEPILSVTPDLQAPKKFCIQIGVDIVILYSSEMGTQASEYRTRVFATIFG